MRTHTLILLALAAACGTDDKPNNADGRSSAANSSRTTSGSDSSSIAAELPGLSISVDSGAITDTTLRLRTFAFRSTQGEWPAGGGIAVFTRGGKLAWLHLANAELRPHTIGLADFDADGRSDIAYYAGAEETFETTVFLNRMARDGFAISNFALAWQDHLAYDPILDFDGNGKPELLMPKPRIREMGEEVDGPFCAGALSEPPLRDEVRAEYFRLAGQFDSLNFRYGSDAYPEMNMMMLDTVLIMSLADPDRRVTKKFRKHLDWRINVLKRAREKEPAACHRQIDALIAYLTDPY